MSHECPSIFITISIHMSPLIDTQTGDSFTQYMQHQTKCYTHSNDTQEFSNNNEAQLSYTLQITLSFTQGFMYCIDRTIQGYCLETDLVICALGFH